jgi:hypothetical protein
LKVESLLVFSLKSFSFQFSVAPSCPAWWRSIFRIVPHPTHLQKKLFEPDGEYYQIWQTIQRDDTLTAVVRSRQLHIYRNGKKVLALAGKSQPKIIREDAIQKQLLNK